MYTIMIRNLTKTDTGCQTNHLRSTGITGCSLF
jgi:hypothetical protein